MVVKAYILIPVETALTKDVLEHLRRLKEAVEVHEVLGPYDIVVELPDGVYVVERTLSVSEAKAYSLSLATVPAENVEKRVSAVDKPVKGYAWTLEGKGPKVGGFWRTPGGIAIIAGGVAGLAYLVLRGDDNKGSNSTPD